MATPGGHPDGWASPGGYVAPGPPAEPPAYSPPPGYPQPAYGQQPYGQPYGYQAPFAIRPGVVPLRPLALGDILDGAISMIRRYPRTVLTASVSVAVATALITFLLQSGSASTSSAGVSLVYSLAVLLIAQIGGLVLAGPISALAGEAVLGRPMTPQQLWARTKPHAGVIAGVAVLVTVIAFLSLIGLIVGILVPLTYFAFSSPAAVLERLGVRAALRRSASLVKGAFWRTLGILLLASLCAGVIALVLDVPFIVVAGVASGHFITSPDAASSLTSRTILDLGSAFTSTFTLPFTAGVHALLYVDQRMRHEGLDVSLRQAASGAE